MHNMFVLSIQGIAQLLERLTAMAHCPKRTHNDAFYVAVDHCFAVKGQGTVLTGTILNGSIEVGQVGSTSSALCLHCALQKCSRWHRSLTAGVTAFCH
jgi:translation elongation factor EF-Tu-like GTPase